MTAVAAHKVCARCDQDLPVTAFAWRRKDVTLRSECRACARVRSRSWYEQNKERVYANIRRRRDAMADDRSLGRAAENERRRQMRAAERAVRPSPAPKPPRATPALPPKPVYTAPLRIPTGSTPLGCVHRWRIAAPDGPTSAGACVHCGAARTFNNSSDDEQPRGWVRSARPVGGHDAVAG